MDAWGLILDPPSPAGYNMAVDEALADSCRRGGRGPTFRLYGWDRPSISVGYFQQAEKILDLDRCRDAGIPVVRRTTGGRAVYHHHEVTYSVAAPVPYPDFPSTIRGTYEVVARALEAVLADLGVRAERRDRDPNRLHRGAGSPLCFETTSRNELTVDGKKLVGSAQRRWPTAFLQHGSILLSADPSAVTPWFPDALAGPESFTGLYAHRSDLTREDVCRALVAGWERTFGAQLLPSGLSVDEAAAVAKSTHSRDLTVTRPSRILV
jgi:lipoate-protein ligase A